MTHTERDQALRALVEQWQEKHIRGMRESLPLDRQGAHEAANYARGLADGRMVCADELSALLAADPPAPQVETPQEDLPRAIHAPATTASSVKQTPATYLVRGPEHCAHVRKGATPNGVLCRDCRKLWPGDEGERVWQAMQAFERDAEQPTPADTAPSLGVETPQEDELARLRRENEVLRLAHAGMQATLRLQGDIIDELTPREPDPPAPDVTCDHGTALDVHCCNCHSGFIFDKDHECQPPPCYHCKEGRHGECVGVPCGCACDGVAEGVEFRVEEGENHWFVTTVKGGEHICWCWTDRDAQRIADALNART